MDAAALMIQTIIKRGGRQCAAGPVTAGQRGRALDQTEPEMTDGRLIMRVGYPVRDSTEQQVGYLWLFEDVTRERQTANQILYLAERDALTGLYNRHRFQEELARMLSGGAASGARPAVLRHRRVQAVNDSSCHRAGDAHARGR